MAVVEAWPSYSDLLELCEADLWAVERRARVLVMQARIVRRDRLRGVVFR